MKLITKLIVGTVVVVLVGGSWYGYQQQKETGAKTRYRTTGVDRGPVVQRITANGSLNPVTVVNVGTQVSGTVLKLFIDYNQSVKAGQVLLELDAALVNARIQQIEANQRSAEANLRLAESTLKRNQSLVDKGFISSATLEQNQKELDVAKAQIAQVKSQLEQEKTNLRYSVIRSPIDGIVIDKKVDIGQTVAASFQTPTLFQIAKELEKMQIDTSVAEADVGNLRAGMPVRFTVDAYPDKDFQGRVRMVRLNPTIQQNVVTYNVIVDVDNQDNLLKPGMTAQVSMVVNVKQDALRIPSAALRFRPTVDERERKAKEKKTAEGGGGGAQASDKREAKEQAPQTTKGESRSGMDTESRPRRLPNRVYKVGANNQLIPVEVRTGISNNQFTELLSGELKEGDELVIRDLQDKGKNR